MKIFSQGGTFEFDDLADAQLSDNIDINILNYIKTGVSATIHISNNTKFLYNVFVDSEVDFDISIYIDGDSNIGDINLLGLCTDFVIKGKINVYINGNSNKINMNTISLLGENGKSDITGNIFMPQSMHSSEGYLYQQNIFLGQKGQTILVPQLNISTQNIKASHGVKIEKLNKDKLFYIQSRGIDEMDSKNLYISGYLYKFFEKFNINDQKIQWHLDSLNQKCPI